MAVLGLIGLKKNQTQVFLENGARISVTQILTPANKVYSVRTPDKNNYTAVQFGIGLRKKANKAALGHAKKAASDAAPFYLHEIRKIDGEDLPNVGDQIMASDIFKEGDIVDVSGLSKGKGFAGVVKRHGFHGGPKTHGQSDRHRAPGAIGQGTTPGRVYKGKRMAGRMGQDTVTIRNLVVVGVTEEEILVKGLVPGIKNGLLVIHKVGESKKFIPVWKPADAEVVAGEEKAEEALEQSAKETQPLEPVEESTKNEEAKEEVKAEEASQELQVDAQVSEEPVKEAKSEDSDKTEEKKLSATEVKEDKQDAKS